MTNCFDHPSSISHLSTQIHSQPLTISPEWVGYLLTKTYHRDLKRRNHRLHCSETNSTMTNVPRRLSGLDYFDHYGVLPPLNTTSSLPPPTLWTFIHIPKTAGDSFMTEAPNHMTTETNLLGNKEYSVKSSKTSVPTVVFLREPISHVLSQFLECKYDWWGQKTTNGTGFPGYQKLDDPMLGFDEWIRHFHQLKDSSMFGSNVTFNCYEPYNMQARFMTSSAQYVYCSRNKSERWPDIASSRKQLATIQVVGVVEHYPASLCVFEYHAGGRKFLTDDCKVCEGGHLKVSNSLAHHSHGVPPHSVNSISNETLLMIKEMTTIDQQLYQTGLETFLRHVDIIRNETGIDLLCRAPFDPNEGAQGNIVIGHETTCHLLCDLVPSGKILDILSFLCIIVLLLTGKKLRGDRTRTSRRYVAVRIFLR